MIDTGKYRIIKRMGKYVVQQEVEIIFGVKKWVTELAPWMYGDYRTAYVPAHYDTQDGAEKFMQSKIAERREAIANDRKRRELEKKLKAQGTVVIQEDSV